MNILNFQENASLLSVNNLHLDARARYFCEIEREEDVDTAIEFAEQHSLPVLVIGDGSNLVLLDDLDAVVLRPRLMGYSLTGRTLEVSAGESWHQVVRRSVADGAGGLENLALIPGSAGAAPVQNIGAYGAEIADYLEMVRAINLQTGERREFDRDACLFEYRNSRFKTEPDWLITSLRFQLPDHPQHEKSYPDLEQYFRETGHVVTHQSIFDAVVAIRSAKLPDPAVEPNVGSFFKNPVVSHDLAVSLREQYPGMPQYLETAGKGAAKLSAAWLIDQAGLKGTQEGGFSVSVQHALVITRTGEGGAVDLLRLVQRVRSTVRDRFGVDLDIEPTLYPYESIS